MRIVSLTPWCSNPVAPRPVGELRLDRIHERMRDLGPDPVPFRKSRRPDLGHYDAFGNYPKASLRRLFIP